MAITKVQEGGDVFEERITQPDLVRRWKIEDKDREISRINDQITRLETQKAALETAKAEALTK